MGSKAEAATVPFTGKREKLIGELCLTLGRKCKRMVSYFFEPSPGMTDLSLSARYCEMRNYVALGKQ